MKKSDDVFSLLDKVSTMEGFVALQEAGCGDRLPQRASKMDVIATARKWAVTEKRRQDMRRALAKYMDKES